MTERSPVLHVSDDELEDLRARLRATRWPTRWPGVGLDIGVDPDELRGLVDLWASGYDWRAHEAAINALPWFVAEIDGLPVHYLRFEAETAGATPVLLTNGWPSSFLEFEALADRLAHPSRHGGSAEDALTVIIPVLPGFAFAPQQATVPGALPTEELWHRLMHDVLGFRRYAAHGGDLGAGVTTRLADAHPEAVMGIHLLAVVGPEAPDAANVTPEERAYLDSEDAWYAKDGGYEHEQRTRPMTLGYGLSDSPAGLLAWILEKFRGWTDERQDPSTRFADDYVLTQASLYWFTNSISTSFRPYWEHAQGMTRRVRHVAVPTAVAVFPADLVQPPRSWAERVYPVSRYSRMPRGGHFAAHEKPQLLADDLLGFVRSLR